MGKRSSKGQQPRQRAQENRLLPHNVQSPDALPSPQYTQGGDKDDDENASPAVLSRIIPPNPPHGIRENGRTVLGAMNALAENELVVIALLIQGGRHRLVGLGPAPELVDDVI